MSTPAFTVGDILNAILGALQDVIGYIATAIAENAQVIAQVIVLGSLVAAVGMVGYRAFRRFSGWLRGLF